MAKAMLEDQLASLVLLLEPTRAKLYRHVAGEREAVSRDGAATAMGITRAQAAFHLDKLVDAGLLRVEYRRLSGRAGRGAGRPAKLYRRSRHRFDATVPPRNPELLARLLTESLSRVDHSPTREASYRYGHALGVRARRRVRQQPGVGTLARCVDDVAGELGFEPMVTADETWARNCPFDPLSREFPELVCQAALAILAGVRDGVGAVQVDVARRERADWCCVVLTRASAPKTATGV